MSFLLADSVDIGGIGSLLTGLTAVALLAKGQWQDRKRHADTTSKLIDQSAKLDIQDVKLASIDHAVNGILPGEPTLRETATSVDEKMDQQTEILNSVNRAVNTTPHGSPSLSDRVDTLIVGDKERHDDRT